VIVMRLPRTPTELRVPSSVGTLLMKNAYAIRPGGGEVARAQVRGS
jgi:hypothetical protein